MSFRQAASKLCRGLRSSAPLRTKSYTFRPNAGKLVVLGKHDFGSQTWSKHHWEMFQWVFLSGNAAFILGMCSMPSLAEDVSIESSSKSGTSMQDSGGLQRTEDGSMISNEHTSKWRIFTDNGRDYFMQGNIDQAEKFFLSALQEAKEGFGERDPHVASACNNLAELYRVRKDFNKAEPLYVEAISILEEHFGVDDIRVGAALHNLGQFYLVQRELEKASVCYERALKIKRRVLGESHPEYADTMYGLGTVLHLQGKQDAEDLVVDSIRILEAGGQGESILCIRRMQYLAQMYIKSNRFAEAEIILRKVLHMMELSKGWRSLDTVIAAERLALALQTAGRLREAEELLERCLVARKNLLPGEHIQKAANMLYIARVKILISNELMKTNGDRDVSELAMAENLLRNSIREARQVLVRLMEQTGNHEPIEVPKRTGKDAHSTAMILLQSYNALGSLAATKLEYLGSRKHDAAEAGIALRQCMSTFKEFGFESSTDSRQAKVEYLSCLRRLYDLINSGVTGDMTEAKEIEAEIQRIIESEVSELGTPRS